MLVRLLLKRNNMFCFGEREKEGEILLWGEVIHPVLCTLVSHVHFPNVGPMHFAILLMQNRWRREREGDLCGQLLIYVSRVVCGHS